MDCTCSNHICLPIQVVFVRQWASGVPEMSLGPCCTLLCDISWCLRTWPVHLIALPLMSDWREPLDDQYKFTASKLVFKLRTDGSNYRPTLLEMHMWESCGLTVWFIVQPLRVIIQTVNNAARPFFFFFFFFFFWGGGGGRQSWQLLVSEIGHSCLNSLKDEDQSGFHSIFFLLTM